MQQIIKQHNTVDTDCIRKNYTILFERLQKVKMPCPKEFGHSSSILLAVCCFLNDVIPLLESEDMLNLVI